jgi:hypothetical protein
LKGTRNAKKKFCWCLVDDDSLIWAWLMAMWLHKSMLFHYNPNMILEGLGKARMLSSMWSTWFHIVQDTWGTHTQVEHYFVLFLNCFWGSSIWISWTLYFYYFYHIYNGYVYYAWICKNQTSQIFDLFIFSWPSQYV